MVYKFSILEEDILTQEEKIEKSQEYAQKALKILLEIEKHFEENDHYWNYRIGYSYFYLDNYTLALHHFERALKTKPEDTIAVAILKEILKSRDKAQE